MSKFEPAHTPLPLVVTQEPLKDKEPVAQMTQSLLVAPVQTPLALKLPSGHVVPSDLVCAAALHCVLSLGFRVNPVEQAMQSPVESAQDVHPSAHTSQLPVESRKNPVAHCAHAVPLDALVHPGRQVHCPLVPHSPLMQLQLDGGLDTGALRQRPLPLMPSSQSVQPLGHFWQVGPKKPVEHVSQDVPLKPVGHAHVPVAEQTPDPEQGGEHAEDSISTSARDPDEEAGSCVKSGTESQRITRLFALPAVTATQTLWEIDNESEVMGTDVFTMGDVGSAENDPCPP
ncbi:hypothetical protein HWV62_16482 [Athelia sp. TMB]|nr:hypothetical protein HWV62_16482 [Athelia sp. TMB]